MRFFLNGGAYPELVCALKEKGHSVIEHSVTWLNFLDTDDQGKQYNELLKRTILAEKPDVYLCTKALKPHFRIFGETHEFIRDHVGATVYWSQDDPFFIPTFIKEKMYRGYDIALTCAACFMEYKRVGMHPYLFWPAFDTIVRTYTPIKEQEKLDFVFVGTPYTSTNVPRKDLVLGLLDHKIDKIELYGNPMWAKNGKGFAAGDPRLAPYYKGSVRWDEVHRLYAKAKMNLSNHVNKAPMYLNDRVPMVLGVEGFLFLDHMPGLNTVFKDGQEVVFYNDRDDFIKKSIFYLHNRDARETIARQGQTKILKEHTYHNRADQLLEILAGHGLK